MSTILGIGTDICSIERFRTARFPMRIAEFYLDADERKAIIDSPDQCAALASRFAAKEAVIKAAPGTVTYLDFSIGKDENRPTVRWNALPAPGTFELSLSHERQYATAVALCFAPNAV